MSETAAAGIEVCGLTVTITVAGANNVLTANDCELAVFGIVRSCLADLQELGTDPSGVVERVTAHVNGEKPAEPSAVTSPADKPDSAQFPCPWCARTFATRQGMTTHRSWCGKKRDAGRKRDRGPADPELDQVARKLADSSPVDRLIHEREEWLRRRTPAAPVLACEDCGTVYEVSGGGTLLLGRHTMETHDRVMRRSERTPKAPVAS